MRCPACQEHLREGDVACIACGFTLASLDSQLGHPPALAAPIADLAGVFSRRNRYSLTCAVRELEQNFPDVISTVVACEVPPTCPVELYAFWLFNRGQLFSAVEKGGDNRGVLLLIDTAGSRAAATLGYGLEPLLPASALETALQAASPHLLKENPTAAGKAFLSELEQQLHQVAKIWPRAFGYQEQQPWFDSVHGALLEAAEVTQGELY